ncbi:hypothetical protein N0V82_006743 [Gnomoniopsis sp. IMI 355080]|nr:hypothetical protein N0V82_006743 [Gnomoniopsis sp. IMI 355080]
MPFFREDRDNMDNEDINPTLEIEAEVETTSRPLPIHGMDQIRRQRQMPMGALRPRESEESLRTDLCEGLLREQSKPRSPEPDFCLTTTSDRAELIERLKRGESPTWVPSRRCESFVPQKGSRDLSPNPRPNSRGSPGLLTASLTKVDSKADLQQRQEADIAERMQQGSNIERPRSALHSGDFTQDASNRYIVPGKPERTIPEADVFNSDLQNPWYATSPPRNFTPFKFERRVPFPDLPDGYKSSPPSLSSSLSSSFVYKHPTSPLVQSESNDDLNINVMDLDPGTPSRVPRRQTLHAFSRNIPATAQRIPSMRRQTTLPYQAHQPRKSLTSAPAFSLTGSPPASFSGSRRTSVVLDSSPLQQTSMVGSYEESILRGRMSTTPSKPLDFMAQIGVLGLGNCKPSLKCPAHVTLPFAAVFYSYASTPHGRSTNDDGPSPYVGQVDLENGLPNPEDSRARQKSRQRASSIARSRQSSIGPDTEMSGVGAAPPHARDVAKQRRRRGASPKAPPGGSYRIPEKGQIQIIIKNQNKTAVKLFLVPYDLAGMEPGTKTFLRQRSYTSGPIVEGTPNPSDTENDKQVLRYLVHLHICCPARGRYYLYKSIRVVFANRVPDGKERLRNDVMLPEPRFTPYKPVRQIHPPSQNSAASLAAERAFRRRSSGFSFALPSEEPVPSLPSWDAAKRTRAGSVQDRGVGAPGFAPLDFAKGQVGGGSAAGGAGMSLSTAEGLLSLRLRGLGMQGAFGADVEEETGEGRQL